MDGQGAPREFNPEMFPAAMGDDLTRWRLQGEDIREAIEHQLRGDYLEKKTVNTGTEDAPEMITIEQWACSEDSRIMNEAGVRRIASVATFMINKATVLSNVNEEEIKESCRNIELALARLMYDNWTRYEVDSNPSSVIYLLMELIYFHLMRAKGGGERESLTKAETTSRLIREGINQPGGGKSMFPFGRGGENG